MSAKDHLAEYFDFMVTEEAKALLRISRSRDQSQSCGGTVDRIGAQWRFIPCAVASYDHN